MSRYWTWELHIHDYDICSLFISAFVGLGDYSAFVGLGDYSVFVGLGEYSVFVGLGDYSAFVGLGDYSAFVGLGDYSAFVGLGDYSAFVRLGDYSVFPYISVCDAKNCYQCAGDGCGGDYGANTNKITKACSDKGSKCFVRIQCLSLY